MYADDMVLMPLVPACFPASLTSAHLVVNQPCLALFRPFCLPLFGQHDTYGRLGAIVRDGNVERLEAYFQLPIEQFMGHFVTFDAEEKIPTLPTDACGMYVHRRIWDMLAQPMPDEWGARPATWDSAEDTLGWWIGLGRAPRESWEKLYPRDQWTDAYHRHVQALSVFCYNLCAVNRLLMPTVNGWQHGNYYAEKLMHETALTVIQDHLAEDAA